VQNGFIRLNFPKVIDLIRIPDAIQIAVGIIYGFDAFLTNDSSLKKVNDIRVVILENFLEK